MEINNKTIIITDPCYIIKNDKDWDLCDMGYHMESLGIINYIVESTQYGDWSCKTLKGDDIEDIRKEWNDKYFKFWNDYNFLELSNTEKSKLLDEFNTFSKEFNKNFCLGEFCADSGLVGVFILDEVLKYNPDFNYHITKPWTTTIIENFNGTVTITPVEIESDYEVRVIGKGNVNFTTIQSGL